MIGVAGYVGSQNRDWRYDSNHVGTISLNTKDVLTPFSSYRIPASVIQDWIRKRCFLKDEFMFGVTWQNNDNMVNFVATWNGVTIVDNVYARPGITGAPPVQTGQARILDFVNTMRVQGVSGNIVAPRNHAKWSTNYGGVIDFGSAEENSYGQNSVDVTNGVDVVWSYYWNGTGAPLLYFDHHQATIQ